MEVMNTAILNCRGKIDKLFDEYNAIKSQSDMLQNQVITLNAELLELKDLINANENKSLRTKYAAIVKRINQFNKQIRGNDVRMASLKRQILVEQQKLAVLEQKEIMKQQKANARAINAQEREMARQQRMYNRAINSQYKRGYF